MRPRIPASCLIWSLLPRAPDVIIIQRELSDLTVRFSPVAGSSTVSYWIPAIILSITVSVTRDHVSTVLLYSSPAVILLSE